MKHMTTIKVKVWDFAHGRKGKKVTKIKYVTVNKAVAKQFKKAFQEIYEDLNGVERRVLLFTTSDFPWTSMPTKTV